MIMQQPTEPGRPMPAESFPTDPTGLPAAARPPLLELADGDAFDLRIGAVAKRLGDTTVRMLGYNGSIPGPTLKVQQSARPGRDQSCTPAPCTPRSPVTSRAAAPSVA
jgi:hypothetical protein